jgi:hypothetical protein
MNRAEYCQAVVHVLEAHTAATAERLAAALALAPPAAQQMTIDIFVDQDGEGFLDVRVGLDGPDLHVLNRAIAPHAHLFATRMTEEGLSPRLPLMPSRLKRFSVHDALTDCAADWLRSVWRRVDRSVCRIPLVVQSPDGYGDAVPFELGTCGGVAEG